MGGQRVGNKKATAMCEQRVGNEWATAMREQPVEGGQCVENQWAMSWPWVVYERAMDTGRGPCAGNDLAMAGQ